MHSTPKKVDFLSSSEGTRSGPKESDVEGKADCCENPGTDKRSEDSNGFLFEEKASDDIPDQELLAKVKLCFDESKIKDVYVLSDYLRDRLTPEEMDEIVNHHSSYSGFIDDDIMDALVGMKTSGISKNSKEKMMPQEKKVIVPNLQPFSDESSDLVVAYTVDDTHRSPRERRLESKVVSADVPNFQAEGDSDVPLSLRRIDPEEHLLRTLNNGLFDGESSVSATNLLSVKNELSPVTSSDVPDPSLGKPSLKCLEESIESLPEPVLQDAKISHFISSLQEDSDGELNHSERRPGLWNAAEPVH